MTPRGIISAAIVCGAVLSGCDSGASGERKAASSAVRLATPDPGEVGPYAIGHTSYVLYDSSRPGARPGDETFAATGRPIVVSVWYPVDAQSVTSSTPQAVYPLDHLYGIAPDTVSADWEKYGIDRAYEGPAPSAAAPFPLLVFSPGAGYPEWGHISLGTRLASHGFVVAVLYHFGSMWWPWEPLLDEIAALAFDRPIDMSFALTDLLARNQRDGDVLAGAINPDRVAAGGWSLGGYAALVLAGARDESVCDVFAANFPTTQDPFGRTPPDWTCAPALPDPRVKAVISIDGSSQVLHFAELAGVAVPSIGIGETWETLQAWFPAPMETWRAREHAALSGHPGYRVDVARAIHPSFSDACEMGHLLVDKNIAPDRGNFFLQFFCGPDMLPSAEVHRIVSTYAIAFLKTNLAGETGYEAILTPGYALTREPDAQFYVTEKGPASTAADWPPASTYFQHQPGSAEAHAANRPAGAFSWSALGLR